MLDEVKQEVVEKAKQVIVSGKVFQHVVYVFTEKEVFTVPFEPCRGERSMEIDRLRIAALMKLLNASSFVSIADAHFTVATGTSEDIDVLDTDSLPKRNCLAVTVWGPDTRRQETYPYTQYGDTIDFGPVEVEHYWNVHPRCRQYLDVEPFPDRYIPENVKRDVLKDVRRYK